MGIVGSVVFSQGVEGCLYGGKGFQFIGIIFVMVMGNIVINLVLGGVLYFLVIGGILGQIDGFLQGGNDCQGILVIVVGEFCVVVVGCQIDCYY